jgi:hypothetical protein
MFMIYFSGGIKGFPSNAINVLKWCLNRPQQALNTKHLLEMTGLTSSTDVYKVLRVQQVQRSEMFVTKATEVMENDFLNPFSVNLDRDEVYNIGSGLEFQWNTDELLDVWNKGKVLCATFQEERIHRKRLSTIQ